MEIKFSKLALKQRELIKKNVDALVQKKISLFLKEVINTPYSGLGYPERLKVYEIPTYSCKIDKMNRLVYFVPEEETSIEVLSIWGHYNYK